MPQPKHASDDTIDRLKRDIATDRARLAFAMQMAEVETTPDAGVGRLYRVFQATGQAQ
jgi:hypothetical protein